jgi:predicted permease
MLLLKLLPIYVLVTLGFVAGRWLGVKSQEIGKVLLYFLGPAVIFKGFVGADLHSALLALPVAIFAAAVLIAFTTLALARKRWSDGRERILAFTAGTGNEGYFGIPACLALIGPQSLPVVAVIIFGIVMYEISVGYYIVMRARVTAVGALKRVAAYPGLHAAWAGLLVNAFAVPLPQGITDTITMLTGAYSPLGMMIVGIGLASLRFQAGEGIDKTFLASAFAVKFVLWPGLAALFIWADKTAFHWFDATAHQVIAVESLVPLAAITVVHATLQDVRPEQASLAVGASTVFALVYLPLMMGVVAG